VWVPLSWHPAEPTKLQLPESGTALNGDHGGAVRTYAPIVLSGHSHDAEWVFQSSISIKERDSEHSNTCCPLSRTRDMAYIPAYRSLRASKSALGRRQRDGPAEDRQGFDACDTPGAHPQRSSSRRYRRDEECQRCRVTEHDDVDGERRLVSVAPSRCRTAHPGSLHC